MSESKKPDRLFNKSDRDDLIQEIPSQISSEIQLRGKATKGFASGRIPWWTLITGWLIFGSITLMLIFIGIKMIINGIYLAAIFPWVIGLMLFSILWRGTTAKLRKKKRQRDRK